jgi:transposase
MEALIMSGWNQAPLPRDQILLFGETLGDRVPADHSVRLMVEILDGMDWSDWERHYVLVAGQPPIHPKVMAGAILYGLTHGIRSSRRLEWACGHAVDFIWLVEGRTIDHATFCGFRTRFKKELQELFRQTVRLAMSLGLVSLNQVALDGTRVKANSSRSATASSATLTERLAVLDAQIEQLLAEAEAADGRDRDLFGDAVSVTTLPPELRDVQRRQECLRRALQAAQQADAHHPERKRATKVPVADPDSAIMPNKEGGYAPNYNPVAAADGAKGILVDADVLNAMREGETVIPTVQRIEAAFGQAPEQFLADATFATGDNLSALAAAEIEAVMPVEQTLLPEDNPAERRDPSQPVAPADWPNLPRRAQTGTLDRAAFVYDADQDCYRCPAGRVLAFVQIKIKERDTGASSAYRVYQSASCAACGLAKDCLKGRTKCRTVSHDQHEGVRRAAAQRMKNAPGRAAYARRAHLAETPNAVIKQVMGLRQFLHRGLEKVRTEWLWACTAFNIRKLMTLTGSVRAPLGSPTV